MAALTVRLKNNMNKGFPMVMYEYAGVNWPVIVPLLHLPPGKGSVSLEFPPLPAENDIRSCNLESLNIFDDAKKMLV